MKMSAFHLVFLWRSFFCLPQRKHTSPHVTITKYALRQQIRALINFVQHLHTMKYSVVYPRRRLGTTLKATPLNHLEIISEMLIFTLALTLNNVLQNRRKYR